MALDNKQFISIQAYKHNGHLHRNWDQSFIISKSKDKIVLLTNKTWVIDEDGRRWHTREPALVYLYPNKWFNVIAILRETGTFYYCNFASPCIVDSDGVKYIDYDLDYKIFPDGTIQLLDEDEFAENKINMSYPKEIEVIANNFIREVKEMYLKGESPFNYKENELDFKKYLDIIQR